uniref:DUF632 domain-containing protein n=1 Tax=Ananas comosus var. bracteatus TaxID=296719 RepID=A0A6V7QAC1_ANACO|nr:unnamed protein product [Ananas comosus var. bracteatus]
MGCAQSRIENEEAVARCKERRQWMRSAVSARSAFAAGHSAYAVALKNTGASLSEFAHHHHQDHSHSPPHPPTQPPQTPADAAAPPNPNPSSSAAMESLPPPPPPLPDFSPSPSPKIHRSISMPPPPPSPAPILEPDEDEEEEEEEEERDEAPQIRPKERAASAAAGRIRRRRRRRRPRRRRRRRCRSPGGWTRGTTSSPWTSPWRRPRRTTRSAPSGTRSTRTRNSPPPSPSSPPPPRPRPMRTTIRASRGRRRSRRPRRRSIRSRRCRRIRPGGISSRSRSRSREVFTDLDEHFLKASESTHEVSKKLEATRMHYHSNFVDGRGHIDHSARVMKVITWNRSFKGMSNADDGKDDFDNDEGETHATVLDKMLAWEKKLYEEVKTGELMKIEYQRKVALLNKQKKRGAPTETLERTKAAVSHLHTRYIVDMQSMDSTVSEIQHLRDNQLYPRLVDLVDEMDKMWEMMFLHHESQLKIVLDLKALDISDSPMEMSEQHHKRTIELHDIVKEWHSQFHKLITHQKEYIQALNNWLKLNLIPIESSLKEKVSSPPRMQRPPIQALLHAWNDHLEKLPEELAKSALLSFAAVMDTILKLQQDEMKQKEKCEEMGKEFQKKSRAFEDWYYKYSHRRQRQSRLDDEVEAYNKLCKQVREKSLTTLKTHLPELFRALSDFARSCADMYSKLKLVSQAQNPAAN